MTMINIKLPDNTVKTVKSGTTVHQIASDIGPGLLKASIAAKINNVLVDLNTPINSDCSLEIITSKSEEAHDILLHSTAHLMAQAVKEIFPQSSIAIGPALKETFYYDIDLDESINDEILLQIEQKMHEISKESLCVDRVEMSAGEAKKIFSDKNEKYKVEIISQIESDDKISAYTQGNFIDLCRGPHVPNTANIKYFKLLSVAGAYWRGDEKNKMLQRIYGTSWFSKNDLNEYLERVEKAKKRDHRKIGRELELFYFDEEVGPGLPLWLPNGAVIIEELENLAKDFEKKAGFDRVRTPHLTKGLLYEKSGHLEHYRDSMYPAMILDDGEEYYVKPMNCPHHHKIYSSRPRSYRDLPVRLAEYGTCYRYEKSGQLFGLMRVRSLQMNDAHIYCTEEQFENEFIAVCKMYLKYFEIFNIDKYQMRLSLHNSEGLGEKYVDLPDLWHKTEDMVRDAMKSQGLDFVEIEGEAAFYGPKIDVQVWSAIGREFTLATNQVDFAIPAKFGLSYINREGQNETPLCIHRAPLSTHERFVGFLIEHYGGNFPLWLSPIQVVILPVSDKFNKYAVEIHEKLLGLDIRSKIDDRSEKIGAKIRDCELSRVPIMFIVGEREQNSNTVSLRRKFKGNLGEVSVDDVIKDMINEIENRKGEN